MIGIVQRLLCPPKNVDASLTGCSLSPRSVAREVQKGLILPSSSSGWRVKDRLGRGAAPGGQAV